MCDNPASYKFIWPGNNESVICKDHVGKLLSVADALGFHLQIIPLTEEDLKVTLTCNQKDG